MRHIAMVLLLTAAATPVLLGQNCHLPDIRVDMKPESVGTAEPTQDFVDTVRKLFAKVTRESERACLDLIHARRWELDRHISVLKKLRRAETDEKKDKVIAELVSKYEQMERELFRFLQDEDPWDLSLRMYAALVYSNLYRDASKGEGYFSKSKPFVELEARQLVWQETLKVFGEGTLWTTISLQTSSETATESVTTFSFISGVESSLLRFAGGQTALNLVGGLGATGFEETAGDDDREPHDADTFALRAHFGVATGQLSGAWEGTRAELLYARDPVFRHQDRFLARGRVVLSPRTEVGKGLGAYLEGSISAGKGLDEARIVVGIQLDTLAILRAIVGASPSSSPGRE